MKREIDSSQDGEHYHIAFVSDQWKTRNPYYTLDEIMARMQTEGIVKHFMIPEANLAETYPFDGKKLKSLPLLKYKEKAVYWLSYLCKVRSTINKQKCCWLGGIKGRKPINRRSQHDQAQRPTLNLVF